MSLTRYYFFLVILDVNGIDYLGKGYLPDSPNTYIVSVHGTFSPTESCYPHFFPVRINLEHLPQGHLVGCQLWCAVEVLVSLVA